MKANELRIGNLVLFNFNGIREHSIVAKDLKVLSEYPDIEEYEPIPLSEEWLIKFGFEVENSFAYSTGEEVAYNVFSKSVITYNSIQDAWWINSRIMDFQPKYVHQLQNLYFALTGTELEINTKQ